MIIDPGSHGRFAGEATISFGSEGTSISGKNIPMKDYEPSEELVKHFAPEYETLSAYLQDTITWLAQDMAGLDAILGPSTMMSLIHQVQLDLSGAQISFTAPLSITALLSEGPLLVSDMFKLYRFENMLYSMKLTGKEIDGFLEHAVGNWFSTLTGPEDHLLLFEQGNPGRLANPYYNFSSAAGINYLVDVSKEAGDRVHIQYFSDGSPFREEESYQVALNSYRGNGGGGHLSSGAGIPPEELSSRILWATDRDLRFYLMDHLGKHDTLYPVLLDNWSIVPETLVQDAILSDRMSLEEALGF